MADPARTVPPRIEPYGDCALLVTLGRTIDPAVNARVHRLVADLRHLHDDGLGVPVPAYASLVVPFAAERIARDRAIQLVQGALAAMPVPAGDEPDAGPMVEILVRYGGEDGPDLADVAARLALPEADVVALHGSTDYRVYMLGFSPGFAYLGTLPAELALPRLTEPRVRVPQGSVAIAERQTAVYPSATAGGWHLIGRTELTMWDATANPPARLAAGQRVRFVPA